MNTQTKEIANKEKRKLFKHNGYLLYELIKAFFIDQIEIYDNMIAPVVESFKYMSPLARKFHANASSVEYQLYPY